MLNFLYKNFFQWVTFLLVIANCTKAFSQVDNLKIVPLSPNAAEIAKYGEVPVSTFTGIPNINIPLYQITSGELKLPLSLSYHAGGNKVESISSWVGLAWNISSIPSISRSVNGSPDEGSYGYFYKYNGRTIRDMFANYLGGYNTVMEDFMVKVRDERADGEPDNFSLSLPGRTYKFLYNQDQQRFVTSPYSNVKINYNSWGFNVIDEDGTQYYFEEREGVAIATTSSQPSIITSWVITRIISSTGNDAITFNYDLENQFSRSLASEQKEHILFPGNYNPPPATVVTQFTSTNALTLRSITFKGGRVEFIKQTTGREDLQGAYALDRIKVLDQDNTVIKTISFNYKYLIGGEAGSGCPTNDISGQKWLMLTTINEIPSTLSNPLKHSFVYNESVRPPCRTSYARDYWGYYNGILSNQQLLPSITYNGLYITGADRSVAPNYTQFGILTKIMYPAGGYTLFEYENNDTQESSAMPTYITETAYLAQEDPLPDGEQLPTYKEYSTIFVINDSGNGVYASADIERMGTPQGSSGAQVIIRRTSPSLPIVQIVVTSSFSSYYLPNGTYELKAVFSQDPPKYQEFSVLLSWQRKVTPPEGIPSGSNNYLGGLRIHRILSYANQNSEPIIKKYTYRENLTSSASTGHSFLDHKFNYAYPLVKGPEGVAKTTVLVTKSYSNQVQVSSSGSYTGYSRVFTTTNDPTQTGLSQYDYSFRQDELFDDRWPFPPAQSTDAFRGQLILQRDFGFKGGQYNLLKESVFEYEDSLLATPRMYAIKTSTELFVGAEATVGFPAFYPYELAIESSLLMKQTERQFDPLDQTRFVETQTSFLYDLSYKQLKSISKKDSKGQIQTTNYYYPYDLSLNGEAETARQWLLAHNNLTAVLKEESKTQNQITRGKIVNFKNFDGVNLVKDYQIITYNSSPANPRILFKDLYNPAGNLLQYHSDGGIFTTYLWGYNNMYPVAEIKNASYTQILNALGSNFINNMSNRSSVSLFELNAMRATVVTALPNAQMTTYTYKPLVGMMSVTDPKGMTRYYEYDGMQRLRYIKDQEGNILTNYDYHYQNQ